MLSRFLTIATLAAAALASPATASISCATCPLDVTDPMVAAADGSPMRYYLVNKSNSGYGTPTYCGYNIDKSHPWYQVFCFYANNGGTESTLHVASDGFTGCPSTSGLSAC